VVDKTGVHHLEDITAKSLEGYNPGA